MPENPTDPGADKNMHDRRVDLNREEHSPAGPYRLTEDPGGTAPAAMARKINPRLVGRLRRRLVGR